MCEGMGIIFHLLGWRDQVLIDQMRLIDYDAENDSEDDAEDYLGLIENGLGNDDAFYALQGII